MGRKKAQDEIEQQPQEGGGTEKKQPCFKTLIPTGQGESIDVCVWDRVVKIEDRDVTMFNVTLQASYRDGEEWKRTSSLKPGQIPVIIYALNQAYSFILGTKDKSAPF